MLRTLAIAILACACAAPDDRGAGEDAPPPVEVPQRAEAAARHSTPVVLFVSPDSIEIDRMKERLGEDFYVVADDAMWYRALAYELVDSLGIPHEEVPRGSRTFMIDGRAALVDWSDTEMAWFAVVYDGSTQPTITADVDIRAVLTDSLE